MNIREFSYNLQKLYQEMSDTFSSYQNKSGLQCMSSCGRCCINPEIEASLYEMIPMALSIYDEGELENWVVKLSTSEQTTCLALIPGQNIGDGKCGQYNGRPSVCRMFGVAGYKNKKHEVTLSICKFLKEHHKLTDPPQNLTADNTPMMTEWSYKLSALEPKLIQERMPINKALLFALQKVALYAQYQEI